MPQPAQAALAAHRAHAPRHWLRAVADRWSAKRIAPVVAATSDTPDGDLPGPGLEDGAAPDDAFGWGESGRRRRVSAKHSPHGRVVPPRSAWRRWVNLAVAVVIVVAAVIEVRLYVVPASDGAGPADAVVVLGGQEYKARLATADVMLAKFPGSVVVVSIPGGIQCPPQPPGASAILCFSPDPSTTQGEARMASKLAAKYGWKTMEVVTTADQVWRAKLRFSR